MLKYSNRKIIEVNDWDKLVRDTYKKIYSFQQQDGCQQRGVHYLNVPSEEGNYDDYPENIPFKINGEVMGVSFNTWVNTSKEDIDRKNPEKYSGENTLYWERNFYPDINVLANDLYKRGLIEKGEYIINIDW